TDEADGEFVDGTYEPDGGENAVILQPGTTVLPTVAITEGPRDEYGREYYEGRVIAINLNTMEVTNFVKAGVNVPVEIGKPGEEGHQTGFDSVDNLAESPDGRLIMIEDNKPSDIWFASTRKVDDFGASKDVDLFASLTDPDAEGTGIYFSPQDPHTLYVNIQHSAADDGDGTWAISKTGKHHDDHDE
ncbi:alkaline phosphatase PhoX, partial [Kaarinaea lacus]